VTLDMSRFLFIAGPCVIESEDLVLRTACELKSMTGELPVQFVFKASFDKANRTAVTSYRGPGLEEGLRILRRVREEVGVPVLSDIHEAAQARPAAEILDVIQVPAFLCRQTDLVIAAAETMKPVNIKKGQFLAPEDMQYVVEKAATTGNNQIMITERGACFGYHNLVVDFRAFSILRQFGCPVIFDATHAVQIPSKGGVSAGNREYVTPLARAAAAYGVDGLFCEVHPEPERAKSDAANSLDLADVPKLLEVVLRILDARGDA